MMTLQFLLPLFLLQFCLSADVIQSPEFQLAYPRDNLKFYCAHEDSSYNYKYWYRQEKGKGPVLIAYGYKTEKPDYEKDFANKNISMEADGSMKSILTISQVSPEDSAIYYCASSIGTTNYQAYFGEGTILAVLGNGEVQKNPKVKIFPPNKREFQDHSLISLVCVATGFFPEHVRLTWFVNDVLKEDVYQNVPTKNEDGTYSTSKRLSLTKSEYFNPDSTFKCKAGFIGDEPVSDEIKGESDCGVSKEHFTMIINQGKISYIMVLFKSGLYALIVLAIIWRKKVLSGSC